MRLLVEEKMEEKSNNLEMYMIMYTDRDIDKTKAFNQYDSEVL